MVLLMALAMTHSVMAQAQVGSNALYGATYIGPPLGGGGSSYDGTGLTTQAFDYWVDSSDQLAMQIGDGGGVPNGSFRRKFHTNTGSERYDFFGSGVPGPGYQRALALFPKATTPGVRGHWNGDICYREEGGGLGTADGPVAFILRPGTGTGITRHEYQRPVVMAMQGETFSIEEGTLLLPGPSGDMDCGDFTGVLGYDTLCDDGGVLSVRHGTAAPVPLESGGAAAHPGEEWLPVSTLGVGAAVETVALIDTTALTPSQGTIRAFAEITQAADGTSVNESAVYVLPVRASYNGFTLVVEGTVGTTADKDAAAAAWDCAWFADGTDLVVDCNGSAGPSFNYVGNVRYYTASGGPN